jgi:radical SAM superfamily enzyme YgiQ (UPF0313 family)
MQELIQTYKAKKIVFGDDLFIASLERLREIVRLFKENKLDVTCGCTVRANLVTNELLGLLKQLNIQRVSFGAESGCDKQLDYLKCSSVSVEQNHQAITKLTKAGLQVACSFIIGSPNETLADAMETYRFVKNHPQVQFEIYKALPYPNTPWWQVAEAKGQVSEGMDWHDFSPELDSFNLSDMTREETASLFAKFDRLRKNRRRNYMLKKGLANPLLIGRFFRKKMWKNTR